MNEKYYSTNLHKYIGMLKMIYDILYYLTIRAIHFYQYHLCIITIYQILFNKIDILIYLMFIPI